MQKGKIIAVSALAMSAIALVFAANAFANESGIGEEQNMGENKIVQETAVDMQQLIDSKNLSTIYLAGGCFWGVEAYMERIPGVYDAVSGYANGTTENPTYQDVLYSGTGHAETVRVIYDSEQVSLSKLLSQFFKVVDPTTLNKQGNDVGTQYRSGVYYVQESDKETVENSLSDLAAEYEKPIVVEAQMLENFYLAEEYHQDYLTKNPNGYCHIDLGLATEGIEISPELYPAPPIEEIRSALSTIEFDVTQNAGTEMAFTNELNGNTEVGIYVDIVTGQPLFLSTDKYDSGTGWPSFTKPIASEVVAEVPDLFAFAVKSTSGNTHLGHVFNDGPQDEGGLRYCINGASLRFVPYNSMVEEGYGYLRHLLSNSSSVTIIPANP